jgi:undecaprenyl-diphosphatase
MTSEPARPGSGAGATVRAGSGAGTTTEAGPLGRVDPVNPERKPGPAGAAAAEIVRPPVGFTTASLVTGLVALVATLVVLGTLARGIRAQEVFALDTWATPFLHGIASPALDVVMNGLTDLGSSLVIVPLFLVVAAWLAWRRRLGALLFLVIASLGALVLNGTMKVLFERPRPPLPWATVLPDYSFPSGHTMNALVFYLALALITWSIAGRRVGLLAIVIAATITFGVGVSRIYLGYHYFTDVVGGVLAGVAWLLIVGAAVRARPAWRQWQSPRSPAPPAQGQEAST